MEVPPCHIKKNELAVLGRGRTCPRSRTRPTSSEEVASIPTSARRLTCCRRCPHVKTPCTTSVPLAMIAPMLRKPLANMDFRRRKEGRCGGQCMWIP